MRLVAGEAGACTRPPRAPTSACLRRGGRRRRGDADRERQEGRAHALRATSTTRAAPTASTTTTTRTRRGRGTLLSPAPPALREVLAAVAAAPPPRRRDLADALALRGRRAVPARADGRHRLSRRRLRRAPARSRRGARPRRSAGRARFTRGTRPATRSGSSGARAERDGTAPTSCRRAGSCEDTSLYLLEPTGDAVDFSTNSNATRAPPSVRCARLLGAPTCSRGSSGWREQRDRAGRGRTQGSCANTSIEVASASHH